MEIGIDLINIKEFEKRLSPQFLSRVFLPSELKNKSKLASIFALKEAAMKTLGKKINWKDIQVTYSKQGKPNIKILGNKNKFSTSLSHDKDYLIAIVLKIN